MSGGLAESGKATVLKTVVGVMSAAQVRILHPPQIASSSGRAADSYSAGTGFESLAAHHALVVQRNTTPASEAGNAGSTPAEGTLFAHSPEAQQAAHPTVTREVPGSRPGGGVSAASRNSPWTATRGRPVQVPAGGQLHCQ